MGMALWIIGIKRPSEKTYFRFLPIIKFQHFLWKLIQNWLKIGWKVVKQKLEAKGVKVLEVFIQRSDNGIFSRCDARIEPVKGKLIDEKNFEYTNFRVIPMFG